MEEKVFTIFIGNTVSKGMASFEGDREHLKRISLAKDPYTFIDWVYDVVFGWVTGKRKDKILDVLGNVAPNMEILDKAYYDAHSGRTLGKVRIVLADLQLNKDLNLMEKMPGVMMGSKEEIENLKKVIYLLDNQLSNLQDALKGQEHDVAMKEVLKMAKGIQDIKKMTYSFNDYLGGGNR